MGRSEREAETSAGEACAAIEAWLSRSGSARPRDWRRVLGQLSGLLTELCGHPLIASDPEARAIIANMVDARDMADLDFDIDTLALRVDRLMAGQAGESAARPAFHMARPATGRVLVPTAEACSGELSRIFLRL